MHTFKEVHGKSAFGCADTLHGVRTIWSISYIDYFKGLHISYGNKSEIYIRRRNGHWYQSYCTSKSAIKSEESPKIKHRKGHSQNKLKRANLFIGGLFDLTGSWHPSGISELTAAKLAVTHVNKRKILPGYRLRLLHNDTKVSA